jgi:hypothetical protein
VVRGAHAEKQRPQVSRWGRADGGYKHYRPDPLRAPGSTEKMCKSVPKKCKEMKKVKEEPKSMYPLYRLISVVVLISILSSCVSRIAHPIKIEQLEDEKMTCGDISFEVKNNESKIIALEKEIDGIHRRNVTKGIFFFMIFPLFLMERSEAQDIEIKALGERNLHLTSLYDRMCKAPTK